MNRHPICLPVARALFRVAAVAVALALVSGASARAVVVANYTFPGNSLASSDSDPSSTASDLTIGAGLSGKTTFFTLFGSTNCLGVTSDNTPATEAAAISAGDYIAITITPASGVSLSYSSFGFNFAWINFSSTITEKLSVRWSVDSFATTLASNMASEPNGSGLQGGGFALGTLPAQSDPVEFRIYFYDDQDNQFSTVGIANLSVTAAVVPEPSSLGLLFLGAGLLRPRRRRGASPAAR